MEETRQVFEQLSQNRERIAAVETRVSGVEEELKAINSRIGGTNKRLDALIFLALAGVVGVVLQWLTRLPA